MGNEANKNLIGFRALNHKIKTNLVDILSALISGDTLSDIKEKCPQLKPFETLKRFGSRIKNSVVQKKRTLSFDWAKAIALDEKVIRKAYNPKKHKNFAQHYVSRVKTYLPSVLIEAAGLVGSGMLARAVGHFFPFPQKRLDENGKRIPLRKHIYLLPFLQKLHQNYGHLPLLADANYATKAFISWLKKKEWHFVMRLSAIQRNLLKPFQQAFAADPSLETMDEWVDSEEFGGKIRILAYRRVWKTKKGKTKTKLFFTVTTLDWDAKDIYNLYKLRWNLENLFKALPVLDRLPGMDEDLFRGFFALILHVVAPMCSQLHCSSKTLAKMLQIPMEIKGNRIRWQNVPTRFARKLVCFGSNQALKRVLIELDF